ncbi:MAG: gamma-glutamyl-gamma-aminobutyrate hydrolase family protein [Ruminococcus sp.]|nr:gamma-glutamyl-gamma-aminobutyrate hydrolase family protein [Ruminococcus sp.]
MIYIKRIGIILREFEENSKTFLGTRLDLFDSLKEFDVNLIGIPITNNFEMLKDTISFCDGIILSGGDNVKDNDFKLVEYLYDNDIPTLGICLGMQIMSKLLGGEEIKVEGHYSTNNYVHKVFINRKSLLFKILDKDEILVNSRHRDGITNNYIGVNAKSEDNIIEGIEDSSKKFFLGVEWHPESLNDKNSYNLFKYFVEQIKKSS